MNIDSLTLSKEETGILRNLARQNAEIIHSEEVRDRIARWKRHNAMEPGKAMTLIFPEGGWQDILPVDSSMRCCCSTPFWAKIERRLRMQIYQHEHFETDNTPDLHIDVPKAIGDSGWGLKQEWEYSVQERGARKFHQVIHEPGDLEKLKHPILEFDPELSKKRYEAACEVFDGILPVRLVGKKHISYHLMAMWTAWRGLEEVMMDMIAEPEFLHDAMAFLTEGLGNLTLEWEKNGLLEPNHDNTYHSSGGNSWLEAPPSTSFDPENVKRKDMWASAESQELTCVGPAMHREFALQYERQLLEPFALNGYACCDVLDNKIEDVFSIPNLRRISISPFSRVEVCAPQMRDRAIFSWKPHPTHLVGEFHPEKIYEYLKMNLEICRDHGCLTEVILKDTHTVDGKPERFDEWSRLARRAVDVVYG
jgi:hypothetical protein